MIRLKTQCRQNAVDQRHAAVLRRARCRLVSAIATLFGVLCLGGAPQEFAYEEARASRPRLLDRGIERLDPLLALLGVGIHVLRGDAAWLQHGLVRLSPDLFDPMAHSR